MTETTDAGSVSSKSSGPDLVTATRGTFEPYVGQSFEVATDGGGVLLTLDNVKTFEGSMVRDNHVEVDGVVHPPRKAFALTFEGPREPVLDAMMHTFRHEELGDIDLYLSPFRQDRDCTLYESVFN